MTKPQPSQNTALFLGVYTRVCTVMSVIKLITTHICKVTLEKKNMIRPEGWLIGMSVCQPALQPKFGLYIHMMEREQEVPLALHMCHGTFFLLPPKLIHVKEK